MRKYFYLDTYQQAVLRTAAMEGSRHLLFANRGLGLAGEAGECCDILKKHVTHGHALDHDKLAKELGDVLWYVAALANDIGYTLAEVASMNIAKLKARYPDGFSQEASQKRKPEDK